MEKKSKKVTFVLQQRDKGTKRLPDASEDNDTIVDQKFESGWHYLFSPDVIGIHLFPVFVMFFMYFYNRDPFDIPEAEAENVTNVYQGVESGWYYFFSIFIQRCTCAYVQFFL